MQIVSEKDQRSKRNTTRKVLMLCEGNATEGEKGEALLMATHTLMKITICR